MIICIIIIISGVGLSPLGTAGTFRSTPIFLNVTKVEGKHYEVTCSISFWCLCVFSLKLKYSPHFEKLVSDYVPYTFPVLLRPLFKNKN
jgi:hypothetical protein